MAQRMTKVCNHTELEKSFNRLYWVVVLALMFSLIENIMIVCMVISFWFGWL